MLKFGYELKRSEGNGYIHLNLEFYAIDIDNYGSWYKQLCSITWQGNKDEQTTNDRFYAYHLENTSLIGNYQFSTFIKLMQKIQKFEMFDVTPDVFLKFLESQKCFVRLQYDPRLGKEVTYFEFLNTDGLFPFTVKYFNGRKDVYLFDVLAYTQNSAENKALEKMAKDFKTYCKDWVNVTVEPKNCDMRYSIAWSVEKWLKN